MRPLQQLLGFLAILLFLGSASARAGEALDMVPPDSEFLFSVNTRQIIDSSLVQKFIKEQGEQLDAQVLVVKNLTGVDVLRNIDRVSLWGRIRDDESVVVQVSGHISEENLVALLKAGKHYSTRTVDGHKIHFWTDEDGGEAKCGTFLPDGSLLISNSESALKASLGAPASTSPFSSGPNAALVPAGSDKLSAWGIILKPHRSDLGSDFKGTLQAESAVAQVNLAADALSLQFTANTTSTEAAQGWEEMMKGGLALLRLQEENEGARWLAGLAKTEADPAKRSASFSLRVPITDVERMIAEKRAEKAAEAKDDDEDEKGEKGPKGEKGDKGDKGPK